jgi:hypothetical protein
MTGALREAVSANGWSPFVWAGGRVGFLAPVRLTSPFFLGANGGTKMNSEKRQVSFKLGAGIFFLPIVFAWWTLRDGYSKTTRIISFVWMAITIIAIVGEGDEGKGNQTPSEQIDSKPAETAAREEKAAVEKNVLSSPQEKESKPEVKAEQPPRPQLGEPFQLGNFAYTIDKLEAVKSIGNRFLKRKAGEGAIFLVVSYTIENLGKETETVMSDDFKIVDNLERTFRPSSKANTALTMLSDSKDYILSEIQPGIKRKTLTAFEIPLSSAQEGVRLIIPEKGLFGTKRVEIPLPQVK